MVSVSAYVNLEVYADEDPDLGFDHVTDPTIRHRLAALAAVTLNASSTPPATKTYSDEIQLAAGAATLDLQALDRGDLTDADFTGLKVQVAIFYAHSTNTDTVTIADGAANGYEIFGDANGQVTLNPGDIIVQYCTDTLDDVAAADSEIDLSSADGDAKVDVLLIAG